MELFLAKLSREGARDSEGEFTVSGTRALKKLAFNQLPRPSAWVLKVVQGAVAARADRIEVRQFRKAIHFQMKGADFGTLEQLLQAWTDSSFAGTQAQNDLTVGLRAVCFAAKCPCLLLHHDCEQGYRGVLWDGERLSKILCSSELVKKNVSVSWVPRDSWALCVFGNGDKQSRAAEFDELNRYAVTCPVRLEVDGREISYFGIKDVSRTRSSIMFSAQTVKTGDLPTRDGIRLPPMLGEGKVVRLAWVLYSDRGSQSSRVSWVRGGVVVEEQTLALNHDGLFFRIFVPAEGLGTDLTTLAPRFPDPQTRQKWIRLALAQLKDDLRPDRQLAQRIATEFSQQVESNWATATLIVLGGVGASILTKGLSLGVAAAFLASNHKEETTRANREGKEKLQALESAVDEYLRTRFPSL